MRRAPYPQSHPTAFSVPTMKEIKSSLNTGCEKRGEDQHLSGTTHPAAPPCAPDRALNPHRGAPRCQQQHGPDPSANHPQELPSAKISWMLLADKQQPSLPTMPHLQRPDPQTSCCINAFRYSKSSR